MQSRTPQNGSVLIEVVIGVGIFVTVFGGILASIQLLLKAQTEHKARIGALALMNEGIEKARSLTYDNVGVVGGTPAGVLPSSESITLNAVSYTRTTSVSYIDDPRDGIAVGDQNAKPNDYKKARVSVSWTIRGMTRNVSASTLIVPDGIEP